MTHVPSWWAFLLLALAAYRTWRLVALDTVTDGWRRRVTRLGTWRDPESVPVDYRHGLAEFISCAWCLGAWVTIGWWAAWLIWPHATLIVAAPAAISSLVGLLSRLEP